MSAAERSGAQRSAQAEEAGWSKQMNERYEQTSKRANGRASGPELTSRFLFVPDHSAEAPRGVFSTGKKL